MFVLLFKYYDRAGDKLLEIVLLKECFPWGFCDTDMDS